MVSSDRLRPHQSFPDGVPRHGPSQSRKALERPLTSAGLAGRRRRRAGSGIHLPPDAAPAPVIVWSIDEQDRLPRTPAASVTRALTNFLEITTVFGPAGKARVRRMNGTVGGGQHQVSYVQQQDLNVAVCHRHSPTGGGLFLHKRARENLRPSTSTPRPAVDLCPDAPIRSSCGMGIRIARGSATALVVLRHLAHLRRVFAMPGTAEYRRQCS